MQEDKDRVATGAGNGILHTRDSGKFAEFLINYF